MNSDFCKTSRKFTGGSFGMSNAPAFNAGYRLACHAYLPCAYFLEDTSICPETQIQG